MRLDASPAVELVRVELPASSSAPSVAASVLASKLASESELVVRVASESSPQAMVANVPATVTSAVRNRKPVTGSPVSKRIKISRQ